MAAEPETRRLLLELVYGLLSEDEAAELRRRIESDAELAAAYAEAQAAAGLFAASARLVAPPISLKRPGTIGPPPLPEPARLKPASRAAGPATAPWERTATWSVAAAASILVVFALSGYAYHLSRLSGIAADHLRLQVLGPSRLQAGAPNRYLVSTTSINGTPVSAQVDFSLYSPEGKLLVGHKEKTNAQGQLPIVVPASAKLFGEARMDLVASLDGAAASERIDARLPVAPPRYQTYLSLSQPVYLSLIHISEPTRPY